MLNIPSNVKPSRKVVSLSKKMQYLSPPGWRNNARETVGSLASGWACEISLHYSNDEAYCHANANWNTTFTVCTAVRNELHGYFKSRKIFHTALISCIKPHAALWNWDSCFLSKTGQQNLNFSMIFVLSHNFSKKKMTSLEAFLLLLGSTNKS